MHKDLLYLVSSHLTDRDRLKLKLYCHTVYFKFINDFKLCCINNYIISIKILSLTNDIFDWNWGLLCACWGGHRDLVYFMINKGANDWNMGLKYSCWGGHRDLVDFMIEKGADDWNSGLFYACLRGYRDLVNLMISKGATLCMHCRRNMDDHLI